MQEYSHKYELVFGICITLNILAGLIYIVWGTGSKKYQLSLERILSWRAYFSLSAEVQPWAAHVETYSLEEKTKKLLDGENQGEEMKVIPTLYTDSRLSQKD